MNRMNGIWLGHSQEASAPSTVQDVTDASLGGFLTAPKAVLMLYSPNCPYSRNFMPIYQSLSSQNPDVTFGSLVAEQNVQTAAKYNLRLMPTVVFFMNGQEVGRIDGAQDAGDFTAQMNHAFSGGKGSPAPTAYGREGTTLESPTKPGAYVLGGVLGMGLLGLIGYLAFGK
jgi:thiol-disulfide isomerase/thioredoxin